MKDCWESSTPFERSSVEEETKTDFPSAVPSGGLVVLLRQWEAVASKSNLTGAEVTGDNHREARGPRKTSLTTQPLVGSEYLWLKCQQHRGAYSSRCRKGRTWYGIRV